jgi:hypothetical protein
MGFVLALTSSPIAVSAAGTDSMSQSPYFQPARTIIVYDCEARSKVAVGYYVNAPTLARQEAWSASSPNASDGTLGQRSPA